MVDQNFLAIGLFFIIALVFLVFIFTIRLGKENITVSDRLFAILKAAMEFIISFMFNKSGR